MPRNLAAWLAVLALAGLIAGCSKKLVTSAAFTAPEGKASSQVEVITWFDAPSTKIRIVDRPPIGQINWSRDSTSDSIAADPVTKQLLLIPVPAVPSGAVHGLVFNRTGADEIEIWRTDPNGGVRRLFDFALLPEHRWLDQNTKVYEFTDGDPKRPAGSSYYARGLVGGLGGSTSPLSAPSRPTTSSYPNIRYFAERWGTGAGGFWFQADSNFVMQWSSVPGASRYLIEVFEYGTKTLDLQQRVLTGAPAPLLLNDTHVDYVASVPGGGSTQYKIGDPGATVYTKGALHLRHEYYVRISAIDAGNQMIATTTGVPIAKTTDLLQLYQWPIDQLPKDVFLDFSDAEVSGATPPAYLIYARGAYWVSPGLNPVPQNGSMERSR